MEGEAVTSIVNGVVSILQAYGLAGLVIAGLSYGYYSERKRNAELNDKYAEKLLTLTEKMVQSVGDSTAVITRLGDRVGDMIAMRGGKSERG